MDDDHRRGRMVGEAAMSHAIVLTEFGEPSVLQWQEVADPTPAAGEVVLRVAAAGVGPTDLNIRAGHLAKVFPQKAGSVLGFEAAGVVELLGDGVTGISVGDAVVALLPNQGGYGELVATSRWFPKPVEVSWVDAAALPASAEAAVGVLHEINATEGETLVVLGGGGSVGLIILQIALARGLRVIAGAAEHDAALVASLGAEHVTYGDGVFERVAALTDSVDAVVDAAGKGGLAQAVAATGNPRRVVTLSDPAGAAQSGARMSEPGPGRAPDALEVSVPLLAAGKLALKSQLVLPMTDAAEAHRLLASGETHDKIVLTIP
jgi:NADPH:quinone reductase-like Zn-dependent oxidoreductase